MSKIIKYLILDRDNNVVGETTLIDVAQELDMTYHQVLNEVMRNKYFYHDCMLIEDEGIDYIAPINEAQFWESKTGTKYFVKRNCTFYKVTKDGKKHKVNPRQHHGKWTISVDKHEFSAPKIIGQYILGVDVEKNYVFNGGALRLNNIKVVPKHDVHANNGYKASVKQRRKVGLYEDDELVRTWDSVRKCAKDMFMSYQTVIDTCNNRYKTKMYDLRYIE